jgi:Geranylgeranyl pyrophosphate synthase
MSIGVPVADGTLAVELRERIAGVEKELADAVRSEHDFVTDAARHVMEAGGKRFRPLVVLLAAQFGDPDASGVVPAALVVELTHLATLYHDDVMDGADVRRGAPSANARWTNSIAIMVGDYLFARASDIVSDLGPDAVRIQARTFGRLVQGQIRETIGPSDGEDAYLHYLSVVRDKTASLVATSARFGAMFAGAPTGIVETLSLYGERLGIAFQLSDDVLDVASETAESGKTPGTDLREGVPTLPVLLAQASDAPEGARLRELLAEDLRDETRLSEALRLLRADRSITDARAEVLRWSDSARGLLADLPDIPARAALDALCDLVVARTG